MRFRLGDIGAGPRKSAGSTWVLTHWANGGCFSRKMTLLVWVKPGAKYRSPHLRASNLKLFFTWHTLCDWKKNNHSSYASRSSDPSTTRKNSTWFLTTGIYNTCFKISSYSASPRKNHHLGSPQREFTGVLPPLKIPETFKNCRAKKKNTSSFQDLERTKRRN